MQGQRGQDFETAARGRHSFRFLGPRPNDRLSHPVKEAAYRAAIHLNPQRGVERLAHFLQAALGIALMRAPQERLRLGGEFATISLTPPVQETGEALGRQAGLVTTMLFRGEDSSSSWLLIISSTDSFLRARESRSYVELRSGPVSANCNSPKYQTIVMIDRKYSCANPSLLVRESRDAPCSRDKTSPHSAETCLPGSAISSATCPGAARATRIACGCRKSCCSKRVSPRWFPITNGFSNASPISTRSPLRRNKKCCGCGPALVITAARATCRRPRSKSSQNTEANFRRGGKRCWDCGELAITQLRRF